MHQPLRRGAGSNNKHTGPLIRAEARLDEILRVAEQRVSYRKKPLSGTPDQEAVLRRLEILRTCGICAALENGKPFEIPMPPNRKLYAVLSITKHGFVMVEGSEYPVSPTAIQEWLSQ